MITSIQGHLAEATPLRATIEINGLGYEVNIPVTTAEKLPAIGATVKLQTLVIYREDAQTLYGFASAQERDFFKTMIEHVSGVGPRLALTIMSRMSLPMLEGAIRAGDISSLSKCPGIGKKTAERLVVELRAKVGTTSTDAGATSLAGGASTGEVAGAAGGGGGSGGSGGGGAGAGSHVRDAVLTLVALGYKQADADESVRHAALAIGPKATTEQLVKKALGG
ncbi:MAG: Holliday junction branch migration protein RuvA [Opitutaceae bacterium]|jgi:Holliday junction DNA helicase RuvA|nr:Holliday junction branch migration protein RuvA [Opitutaceae bacterium]